MRIVVLLVLGLIFALGCARVRVEAPKEPIKVDISMRLDIYQHIEKDIDQIENIVSGSPDKNKQSFLDSFVPDAYAQDGLSPEVEEAALRRKDRRPGLISWQEKGVVGENKSGLVEIRIPGNADVSVKDLVGAENNDRMLIYQAVARKNNSSVEDVEKIYAKRLQQDAPSGTPIEVLDETTGIYEWKIK